MSNRPAPARSSLPVHAAHEFRDSAVTRRSRLTGGCDTSFAANAETLAGQGRFYVKLLPDGKAVQADEMDDFPKMKSRCSPDGTRIAYTTALLPSWPPAAFSRVGGDTVLGGQPTAVVVDAEGLDVDQQRHRTAAGLFGR
jgi:hypothetical protein